MGRIRLLIIALYACATFAWIPGGSARRAPDALQVELFQAVATPERRLLALPDPSRTLTNAANCAGWYEPRVYMESQGWFTL
jgi:hypothetical protein